MQGWLQVYTVCMGRVICINFNICWRGVRISPYLGWGLRQMCANQNQTIFNKKFNIPDCGKHPAVLEIIFLACATWAASCRTPSGSTSWLETSDDSPSAVTVPVNVRWGENKLLFNTTNTIQWLEQWHMLESSRGGLREYPPPPPRVG